MRFRDISVEVADSVQTITLERPTRLNAVTEATIDELIEAFNRSDADDSVRAVVVTGRGRAFCAGADLSGGGTTFDPSVQGGAQYVEHHRDGGGRLVLRIYKSLKPVIAAVNGDAVGLGATMTLPMDVRIATETARFGFVFTRRGIVPDAASSWFLPRVVGISKAVEWATSGRLISATEAADAGLVRSLHAPQEVLSTAYRFAADIVDHASAVSVALTRQLMWRMLTVPTPMQAHLVDSALMFEMGRSPDSREGVESFLEKRPPRFPMKVSADMPQSFPWRGDDTAEKP